MSRLLSVFALCAFFSPAFLDAAPTTAALDAAGTELYYRGDAEGALAQYEKAVALSSTSVKPRLNGAVVLEELGKTARAIDWYRRAAELAPVTPAGAVNLPWASRAEALSALGWAQLRVGKIDDARASFQASLSERKDDGETLVGLARVETVGGRPSEALNILNQALAASPLLNLIPYFRAKAHESLGDVPEEVDDYRQAVIADSYFLEARDAIGRVELSQRHFNEAWKQFAKILDVEPRHRGLQNLIRKVTPLLTQKISELRPRVAHALEPYVEDADDPRGKIPVLRIGIGSNAMGHPTPRQYLTFRLNGSFSVVDSKGKRWSQGRGFETWQARVRFVKKKMYLELAGPGGKPRLLRREAVIIRPDSRTKGIIILDEIQYARGSNWTGISDKLLRGDLELSLYPAKRSLRLVNILDLENYTNGVVAAEMPIQSPVEALKAQAVVARSHALFIKNVTRRHRRDGYDVCDEQHCQVYAGARAESGRSRAIVQATRGRIVTYHGKVAHVIYSSNCGGHTQSGKDLTGWGDVPYWTGISDDPWGDQGQDGAPRSPWKLRRWLATMPASYCRPSNYVHPSHFRWTRVMAFRDIEEKIGRKYKRIGRLLQLRAGRRSPSGNVNSLIVRGTKKSVTVKDELTIRGLLGLGSLRSTMFVFDMEHDGAGKPLAVVFHGGGWGHGVGLCQSGAMGRADAGQNFEQIIRAYFKGVELGELGY